MSDDLGAGGGMQVQTEVVKAATGPSDVLFIAAFQEFNDASRYPAPQRQLWLNTAMNVMDPNRWADYYEIGVYLWTAHHLAVFGDVDKRRRNPGRPPLLMSSKSIGGVSASYDTNSVLQQGAGLWNATSYGIRWLDLARLVGMGGVQIGYGPFAPGPGGPGFSGPLMPPIMIE